MIRDITIGQYYPTDSILHKLDPRVKIVGTLLYLVSLFLVQSILGYLIAVLFLVVCVKSSKVPVSYILRGLRPLLFLLSFTIILNLFMTAGGNVIVSFWRLKITENGLRTAVFMAMRLVFLIMGSSLMTFTTTPNALTDGIESLLNPLKKIKLPVHEIAMMMSIALRFIPILLEETDKIMKAQIARGADLESGNVFQRVKSMVPILVPLFVSAFRRAGDLAMAMEARCYRGGVGRTKMKPLIYVKRDVLAYTTMFIYLVTLIGIGRYVPFTIWIF
jgi:ABC-type cobalt transport system, permease component CbiQ and related transporters